MAKFTIGQMKEVVVFKVNTGKAPLGAGILDGYQTLLTTRGMLQKQSGAKENDYGEVRFSDAYVLICRFQEALKDNISTQLICEINGKVYAIDSYELIDQKRFYYKFILNGKTRF